MNWIILLSLTQVVWGSEAEYYHKLSVDTLVPPGFIREGSLFGFSTTYDIYNKRLIVGAPRTNNYGDVYDCELDHINKNSCQNIDYNITRDVPGYDHDYLLGATVRSGKTSITACAPRYTLFHGQYHIAGMYGRCYQRKMNNTSFDNTTVSRPPTTVLEYSEKKMDSLGWSLDVINDDEMLIGGPSMYHDTGLVMLATKGKKLLFRGGEELKNVQNFGYSVAAGNFLHPTKLSYAVGSTYGTNGTGQIYFYTSNNRFELQYKFKLKRVENNDEVGSMFGAVLCAAKINNRGSDLLVGAPTFAHKESGFNTGAVYVYRFGGVDRSPVFVRKIVGSSDTDGSLFGSAIVTVGDLNGDKKDEIAIGAPYEGNGVVYLYSGAHLCSDRTEKVLLPLQKIKSTGYISFGYSLAALQDYDENGCNELAISAPYNNTVMLYKCFAAITVTKLYAKFPVLKNRTKTGQEDFEFKVCMELEYPNKPETIDAELSTNVQMIHQHAVLKKKNNGDAYKFTTILNGNTKGAKGTSQVKTKYCEPVQFTLPKDKDYSMAIRYDIKTTLMNNPIESPSFNGKKVILSDNSQLETSDIVYAAECAGDECIPNLSMTINGNIERGKTIITGSEKDGIFNIKVNNTGEVAYEPCIQFRVIGANLKKQPRDCSKLQDIGDTWKCTSRSPVKTDAPWELNNIVLDFGALTDQNKEVKLVVKLFNRCIDVKSHAEDEYVVHLEANYEDIQIFASTDIGDIVKWTKDDLQEAKQLKHIYKIINYGVTNFKELEATVKLLKSDFITTTFTDTPVLLIQDNGNSRQCDLDPNSEIVTAKCKIEISSQKSVQVFVLMETIAGALKYDNLQIRDEVVNSTLILQDSRSENASTTIHLWEGFVDWWVLILAALVGLLLIIILAVILYKCGFLQRRKKKQLERLKNDVKRQTVRRSMMLQRQSQMPPDRQQILERMEETDEAGAADEPQKCEKAG